MSLDLFEWLILGEAAGDPMAPPNQPPNQKKKQNTPQQPNPNDDMNQPQGNDAGAGDEPPDFTQNDATGDQPASPAAPPNTQQPEEDPTMGTGGGDDGLNPPDEPPAEGEEGTGEEGEGGEENPEEMQAGEGETELQAPGDNPQDELKSAEAELFQDLGPDKLAIKTEELKTRFKDLYDSINGSLDKLNKISRTTDDADEIDFLVRKLLDIRDLTRDGLIKSFVTKTYVENQVELKRLIALYGAITSCFTNILYRRGQEQKENAKGKVLKRPKLDPLSGFTKSYDVQ